ncbi:MAG: hypothetical protein CMJ31_05125 [Phycisphaerae bacterium]|nr:hypothetical protein [Phycisphaerae bacterium]
MYAETTDHHRWLDQLVGDWVYEGSCDAGPDAPPMSWSGRESVRKLGDLWVIGEGVGSMPDQDGEMRTVMTLGFDTRRGRFCGTFVCSVFDHMFVYDGTLNDERKALTLDTEGPDFQDPAKLSKYQDIIAVEDASTRTLTSRLPGPGSGWTTFMQATYKRS